MQGVRFKFCSKCKRSKICSDFYKTRNEKSDGLSSWCKWCSRQYQIKTAERRRERNWINRGRYIKKYLYHNTRRRALIKGLPFTITLEDIVVPEFCPVLGIKLEISRQLKTSPSLDAIIPSLGYIPGNVAVISNKANVIKSYGTAEEHRKIADWIDKNKPKTELT